MMPSDRALRDLFAQRDIAVRRADELTARVAELEAENVRLRALAEAGRRAVGEHFAPNDCYATGPMTGDPYRDLVECPACSFIAMHDAALTKSEA